MDFSRQLQNAITVVDRWLAYLTYADQRLVGLSAGIVYNDSILFSGGYGFADLARRIRATETTCYRIASISKIFTTVAIMQLVEQGKLSLDNHVQEYLPWFTSSSDQNLSSITLRQMLTHTAGLDRDGDTPHWMDFQFPALLAIQQHVAEGATVYKPVERWKYSNYGFTLLGAIIAQVSGMSYEDYVMRNIVERLHLEHTAPTLTDAVRESLAIGYSRTIPGKEKAPFPAIETNVMASATGFSSNVLDMCRFMMAQFEGNTQLLRDETKREMRRIQWLREGTGTTNNWCLGLETWEVGGRHIYGHGGSFPGYKSRFGIDLERNIGVVVMANAIDAPSAMIADGIWETINYFITQDEEFKPIEPPHADVSRYEGTYRSIWEDTEVVAVANHLLLFDPAQLSPITDIYRLRYEQDGHYRTVSGDSFGHIGEIVRFEQIDRKRDTVNTMIVGSNPLTRLSYLEGE